LNVSCLTKPIISAKLHEVLINSLFYPNKLNSIASITQNKAPDQNEINHINILAVDDNEANLKLLRTLLEDMGHTVFEAMNGAEAVEQIQINTPDLVFMDIQMPVMDGVEATKTIRSLDERKYLQIPIIALTAHALSGEKEALIRAGLNDYLTKPVSEEQLRATISKWVDKGSSEKSQEPPIHQSELSTNTTEDAKEAISDLETVSVDDCLKLAANKEGLAKDMLKMLVESFDRDIPPIAEAMAQNARNDLLNTVHKVHGGTRYTGVPKLRQICHDFESAIKEDAATEELEMLYQSFLTETDAVKEWVSQSDWLTSE